MSIRDELVDQVIGDAQTAGYERVLRSLLDEMSMKALQRVADAVGNMCPDRQAERDAIRVLMQHGKLDPNAAAEYVRLASEQHRQERQRDGSPYNVGRVVSLAWTIRERKNIVEPKP